MNIVYKMPQSLPRCYGVVLTWNVLISRKDELIPRLSPVHSNFPIYPQSNPKVWQFGVLPWLEGMDVMWWVWRINWRRTHQDTIAGFDKNLRNKRKTRGGRGLGIKIVLQKIKLIVSNFTAKLKFVFLIRIHFQFVFI